MTWKVYLLLRAIADIVFSPVVLKSMLSFLNGLITEFLTSFKSVFGVGSLTPKHHYMIHYPRFLHEYGPLRPLWCMRHESMHQYFKSVVASLGNYINVTNTMANRHQMRQCWEFLGEDILKCETQPLRRTKICTMADFPVELRSAIANRLGVEVSVDETVTTTTQLFSNHVSYTTDGCLLLTVVEEEDVPIFLKIKFLIYFRNLWLLCGRLCFSERFCSHLHAFSVRLDEQWSVVYPGQEVDYSLHDFFVLDDCNYVNCRYHVPSTAGH